MSQLSLNFQSNSLKKFPIRSLYQIMKLSIYFLSSTLASATFLSWAEASKTGSHLNYGSQQICQVQEAEHVLRKLDLSRHGESVIVHADGSAKVFPEPNNKNHVTYAVAARLLSSTGTREAFWQGNPILNLLLEKWEQMGWGREALQQAEVNITDTFFTETREVEESWAQGIKTAKAFFQSQGVESMNYTLDFHQKLIGNPKDDLATKQLKRNLMRFYLDPGNATRARTDSSDSDKENRICQGQSGVYETRKFTTDSYHSSFVAELMGLEKSLALFEQVPENVIILSDCKNALEEVGHVGRNLGRGERFTEAEHEAVEAVYGSYVAGLLKSIREKLKGRDARGLKTAFAYSPSPSKWGDDAARMAESAGNNHFLVDKVASSVGKMEKGTLHSAPSYEFIGAVGEKPRPRWKAPAWETSFRRHFRQNVSLMQIGGPDFSANAMETESVQSDDIEMVDAADTVPMPLLSNGVASPSFPAQPPGTFAQQTAPEQSAARGPTGPMAMPPTTAPMFFTGNGGTMMGNMGMAVQPFQGYTALPVLPPGSICLPMLCSVSYTMVIPSQGSAFPTGVSQGSF